MGDGFDNFMGLAILAGLVVGGGSLYEAVSGNAVHWSAQGLHRQFTDDQTDAPASGSNQEFQKLLASLPADAKFETIWLPTEDPDVERILNRLGDDFLTTWSVFFTEAVNSTFLFPRALTTVMTDCPTANAYWNSVAGEILICYQLLPFIEHVFTEARFPAAGLDRRIEGALLFIAYHEMGHAALDEFGIPALGREEDTADEFAMVFDLIRIGDAEAILASAFWLWWLLEDGEHSYTEFADEHALAGQRAMAIACMGYGANRTIWDDLARQVIDDEQRLAECELQYEDKAVAWLDQLWPYWDCGLFSCETAGRDPRDLVE